MRMTIFAAITILWGPAPAAAAPSPPPILMPTGPWNVEFAEKMCHLSRPYSKDGQIALVLKPSMVGNNLEIIVIKGTTSSGAYKFGKAVLAIAGNSVIDDAHFTAYSTAKARLMRIQVTEGKFAISTVRGTLSIDAKPEGHYVFNLPGIERALPILSQCVDQLRTVYKVEAKALANIVAMPEGSAAGIFSANDYPSEALSAGRFGTVGVLAWIESNGRVSTCEIIESSGGPTLEQATCNILKRRARLRPAKDVSGKAVRAPIFTRVRWVLPS